MAPEQQKKKDDMDSWHLDKRVSVSTLMAILVIAVGGLTAFMRLEAQTGKNAESIEELDDVPERVIRIEEQLKQLREDQSEIKDALNEATAQSSQADAVMLQTLRSIQDAIVRLETRLENN